jgi:hypothetical protein
VLERVPAHAAGRFYQSCRLPPRHRSFDTLGRLPEAAAAWQRAIDFDDRHDPAVRRGLDPAEAGTALNLLTITPRCARAEVTRVVVYNYGCEAAEGDCDDPALERALLPAATVAMNKTTSSAPIAAPMVRVM